MRFTIRDLFWLMIAVGLGTSIFTDGLFLRRQMAQAKQESALREQEHATALANFNVSQKRWREENMRLYHQIVVLLEKTREQEAELAARSQELDE